MLTVVGCAGYGIAEQHCMLMKSKLTETGIFQMRPTEGLAASKFPYCTLTCVK